MMQRQENIEEAAEAIAKLRNGNKRERNEISDIRARANRRELAQEIAEIERQAREIG